MRRVILIDSARLIERHSFYFELVPYLATWGYNGILWHFSDDEGCSLKFRSRPELASRNAFGRREMERFISHADAHGLEVIPELESFGHTGYITRRARYRRLSDHREGRPFSAICPSHPETLEILRDLIGEVAEIFPSRYIHAGFDEASFGSCARCEERMKREGPADIFLTHLEAVHGLITEAGKRMMIWSDHLLQDPEIADRAPKDIVVCDWHYHFVDPSTVASLTERGFEVMCCPALMCAFSVIFPGENNLTNIRDFAKVAAEHASVGVTGVVNTVWCPYRHLQGAVVPGIARAGRILSGEEDAAHWDDFVEDYFGVTGSAVGHAVGVLHEVAPDLSFVRSLAPTSRSEFERLSDSEMRRCERLAELAGEAAAVLKEHRARVASNVNHYDDILMSAEIMAGLAANGKDINALLDASREGPSKSSGQGARVKRTIRSLAQRTRALYEGACACWNRTRFENDPTRDGRLLVHRHDDSIVCRLRLAARFFENLQRDA